MRFQWISGIWNICKRKDLPWSELEKHLSLTHNGWGPRIAHEHLLTFINREVRRESSFVDTYMSGCLGINQPVLFMCNHVNFRDYCSNNVTLNQASLWYGWSPTSLLEPTLCWVVSGFATHTKQFPFFLKVELGFLHLRVLIWCKVWLMKIFLWFRRLAFN